MVLPNIIYLIISIIVDFLILAAIIFGIIKFISYQRKHNPLIAKFSLIGLIIGILFPIYVIVTGIFFWITSGDITAVMGLALGFIWLILLGIAGLLIGAFIGYIITKISLSRT